MKAKFLNPSQIIQKDNINVEKIFGSKFDKFIDVET